MTPQEKAKELVDKMCCYQVVHQWDIDGEFNERAKQCALIAVDEILNLDVFGDYHNTTEGILYWEQVKEEIEKL